MAGGSLEVTIFLMMLASNFDALLPLIFGVPLGVLACGLAGLILAARGHWTALIFAVPCAMAGLLLTCLLFADGRPDSVMPALWVLFPAPLVLGGASIALWLYRRRAQKRK